MRPLGFLILAVLLSWLNPAPLSYAGDIPKDKECSCQCHPVQAQAPAQQSGRAVLPKSQPKQSDGWDTPTLRY